MLPLLLRPALLFQAAATPAADGSGTAAPGILDSIGGSLLVPLAGCFAVFWFFILRPESKQRKKRLEMLANLKKGDRVQTNSGLLGTVVQVQDNVVTLQVDEGVRLKYAQSAIGAVMDDDGQPVGERK